MKLQATSYKLQSLVLVCIFCFLIINLLGCDAFARKFTRKSKEDDLPKEQMVLVPEEYKSNLTKEEEYRQSLLYWKSWQDELISSLSTGANHKKQIDCVSEAIKNLMNLRVLLNTEMQKKLDGYIIQLENLKESISKDVYGNSIVNNRMTAERIKRNILRDFPYNKMKDSLV
ncbi:MAG: hypothetical protein NTW64_05510 [Candidatus Omnitrophica bacterium]|nr:hypothetical protein [Candidatus Omnitrophota bacterium]